MSTPIKAFAKRVCNYLNRKSQDWSTNKKKVVWISFIFISVSACAFAMVRPFMSSAKTVSSFGKTIVISPLMQRISQDHQKAFVKNINRYKLFLDSLALYDTAKYRAILKQNPHVLENLETIQSFFSHLIKR
jgi:hypothetical protein